MLDREGIRGDVNAVALKVVRRVTRKVLTRSALLCPVKDGRLAASGRMKVGERGRGPQGVVEYPVKYAAAVHDGTGPRVIRPNRRKALAFKYGGKEVVVKSVHHPGSKAQPFLADAAKEVAAEEGLRFIPRRA